MKRLALVLIIGLWSPATLAQSIGVFADPLGTDCNLIIPYPGGSVTAYAVGTIDRAAAAGVTGTTFRIAGLPEGWIGSVTAAGPAAPAVVGNPFAEGVAMAYPICVTGSRVLLTLSITPTSSVENGNLVILPHAGEGYHSCGFEGQACSGPCPLFCGCGNLRLDCYCAEAIPATINGPPCVVGTAKWSWGKVKSTYK